MIASAPLASRPLSIGEIFDRAVTLLVRRWRAALICGAIVSLPGALAQALIVADAASPFTHWVLGFVDAAVYLYAFAALVAMYGGLGWRVVAASPGRLLRAGLLARFLVSVATMAVGAACAGLAHAAMAARVPLPPVMIVAGGPGIVEFALIAPLALVGCVAVATAVLEGSGGTRSVTAALSRALARGGRVRTVLLAYALGVVYIAPDWVVGAVFELLAKVTDQWWLTVAMYPIGSMISFGFTTAVVTVAANDYRVRCEGADLEAVLDAPLPA